MDYDRFYKQLFKPVEAQFGPFDPMTVLAVVGFDLGGPLSFSTIGHEKKAKFGTFITCELACREEQQPSALGRYELLITCDEFDWCRGVLSDLGPLSTEAVLGHGHTVDIGGLVKKRSPIQGIALETFASMEIDGEPYGIFQCHGLLREEMEFAQQHGVEELLGWFRREGIYPRTSVRRKKPVDLKMAGADASP